MSSFCATWPALLNSYPSARNWGALNDGLNFFYECDLRHNKLFVSAYIISTGCWPFVSYIGRRSEALTLIQGHNEWRLKYEDGSIVFVRSVVGGRN